MPTVSVIVPNYNHAPFLRQRVESVLGQSFQDFELILLDDCSTDGSREIMESYRNNPYVSHIVYNERNCGSAFRQWDKGIEMAQGEWVWIAESDDYAEPTFLERLMSEVAKVPDCTLAYTATWWVDEDGNRMWNNSKGDGVIIHNGDIFIREKMTVCNPIANVSECVFRRESYRPSESNRYEHMRLCGDWFFYVLLAEQGNVVELEEPLSYYRQHSSNISSAAESRGLTFLEGAEVLEYMIDHCGLKAKDYAKGWGRLWAKYERQYRYSSETNKNIRKRFKKHRLIVLYYYLYRLKLWLNQNNSFLNLNQNKKNRKRSH